MTAFKSLPGMRGLAVAALLVGSVLPALAENNWYVGVEYDRVKLDDSEGRLFTQGQLANGTLCLPIINVDPSGGTCTSTLGTFEDIETKFDDDNGFALSLGYDFEGLVRVDISAKRMKNEISEIGGVKVSTGEVKSTSLLSNLWFDFNRKGVVQPYVGLGVGASKIKSDDGDDTVLFGQAGLGLNFKVSDEFMIDLGGRYFDSRQPEFDNSTIEYSGTNLVLGLRFNFPGEVRERTVIRFIDSDGDGVADSRDQCPGTPPGTPVNENGCSDLDGDGVIDPQDRCPGTPLGTPVDEYGCSDSDGDGIGDHLDSCPNTRAGESVMTNGCAVQQSVILEGVNFEFDSAKLQVNAQRILDLVAKSLLDSPNFVVELQGHTDNVGTDSYNLMLSQDRANAVKAYLVGRGVAADRMVARGYGERQPIKDNSTEEGRERNRRVEMKVLAER
ncbi:OmpA family protein [Litorivivens sp.]|uniref:OmpA family protein n=1 Tax=Litorivivens sp. TaxID=2020868 RepID=UPI0035626F8D